MSHQFLPTGLIKASDNYFKPQDGENTIRIVSDAVYGWVDWRDKAPLRFRYDKKPERPIVESKPVKMFIAFAVWDYASKELKIYNVEQKSVQGFLSNISQEKGHPKDYDLKIFKTGSAKDTKYMVVPLSPSPLPLDVQKAVSETYINLDALFEGKNPFREDGILEPKDQNPCINFIELDELDDLIVKDPDAAGVTKKILDRFGILKLEDIPASSFENIKTWLVSRQQRGAA